MWPSLSLSHLYFSFICPGSGVDTGKIVLTGKSKKSIWGLWENTVETGSSFLSAARTCLEGPWRMCSVGHDSRPSPSEVPEVPWCFLCVTLLFSGQQNSDLVQISFGIWASGLGPGVRDMWPSPGQCDLREVGCGACGETFVLLCQCQEREGEKQSHFVLLRWHETEKADEHYRAEGYDVLGPLTSCQSSPGVWTCEPSVPWVHQVSLLLKPLWLRICFLKVKHISHE